MPRISFEEFIKSVGQDTVKGSSAQEAYSMITEIMHIDNTLDDRSVTDCKKATSTCSFKKSGCLFFIRKIATHNSTIGKALAYSIKLAEYLRVFLSDGNIPMDNYYAEQTICLFTIDRKTL